jgi:hypothetical protein
MTSELEEEIKRLSPGVALLVSNEIERPITVSIRPRKSRHGGVSTPIVAKPKKHPAPAHGHKKPEVTAKMPKKEQKGGGLFQKVFGARRA